MGANTVHDSLCAVKSHLAFTTLNSYASLVSKFAYYARGVEGFKGILGSAMGCHMGGQRAP